MQVPADGESLFTISDRNEVWIMANVYAKNIRSVKKDMEAFVKTSAYPEEVFVGKINLLAQVFDEEERVVKARIEMSNPENKLLPGMYVEVFLEENASESALAIPTNALIFDDNQHFVLRYKSDCEVAPIPVSILSERQGTTFVSGNLQAGNLLINKNHLLFFTSLKEQKNKPTK